MEKTKRAVSTVAGVFLLIFVGISIFSWVNKQSKQAVQTQKDSVKKSPHRANIDADIPPRPFPTISVGRFDIVGSAQLGGAKPVPISVIPVKQLAVAPVISSLSTGLPQGKQSDLQKAQYIATNFTNDASVHLTASYQRKSTPGMVYYEFHRDWQKGGLPVVHLMSLFNLPADFKYSDLTLSEIRNASAHILAPDPDIFSTSDNTDGKVRSDLINTLTIGLKNGKVASVSSTLRLPDGKPEQTKAISYLDAVKKLRANKYEEIYTSPVGEGPFNHDVVYPGNKASLKSVSVTDSTLAYPEELPFVSQSRLVPKYIFRGTGTLDSGFQVNVLVIVPAVEKAYSDATTATASATLSPESQCLQDSSAKISNLQISSAGTVYGQEQNGTWVVASRKYAEHCPVRLTYEDPNILEGVWTARQKQN